MRVGGGGVIEGPEMRGSVENLIRKHTARHPAYNQCFSTDVSVLVLIRVTPPRSPFSKLIRVFAPLKIFSTPSKKIFLTRFLGDLEGSFFSNFFSKKS